jgi:serine/threonine-protein kinase
VRGIVQFIKADDYRGQRVRLSGWVRQTDIRGTDIGLWMRVDGPGVIQGFDNFSTRPLTGTSDWHQVEIILDVPDDAIGISLGALMSGAGVFRVDDLKFEVIPPNGLTTNILLNTVSSSDLSSQYAGRSKVPANLDFEQ